MAYERILASTALAIALIAGPAQAQKSGGVLKVFFFDSPATMSIHEDRPSGRRPMMNVFKQPRGVRPEGPAKRLKSIVPTWHRLDVG